MIPKIVLLVETQIEVDRLQGLISNVDYVLPKNCRRNQTWTELIEKTRSQKGSAEPDPLSQKKQRVLACDDEALNREL